MNYDDIINAKYVNSDKHKRMSLYDRSAQFAPFAALTGYGKAINDASRIKQEKIYLDKDEIEEINKSLSNIKQKKNIEVVIIYFSKYLNETKGVYKTIYGKVDKINEYEYFITINGIKILFDDILSINIK